MNPYKKASPNNGEAYLLPLPKAGAGEN